MSNGWSGKVLTVNLTKKTSRVKSLPASVYHKYIGGKGLAGYFLREHITRSLDDPQMPLLFFTGPLVNTKSPTSGRMTVMSRSPQTGTVGDCSVGGSLGNAIKKAGIDGIIITGKSDELCGIEIENQNVKIINVPGMRGKTTHEIHDGFSAKGAVASIGPAAENGVRFSCIVIDNHYVAGRNGLGAVCAKKNLKYLTVKGSNKTLVNNKDELAAAREQIFRLVSASPILMGELGITNFGTGALLDLMDTRRMMPTQNFQKTHFSNARHANASVYKERYKTKKTGCKGCHILCKKKGISGEVIPEFETMSHFTALINNKDVEAVVEANDLCNQYGMDTISTAGAIACYSEITGTRITSDLLLDLISSIGLAKGIGRDLGAGSLAFAKAAGKPELSMSVKGLELPAYDPRGAYGMALAYVTSTRGACHLRAYPIGHEILRKPVATDRFSFDGKARIIKISEDLNAVVDSLTACRFTFLGASLEEYAKAYTAVTGVSSSAQELLKVGERIYYNERIMNALNGFDAKDDDLPERFFNEDGSHGDGIIITRLDRDAFLDTRSKYYRVRGLSENGIPKKEIADELGLKWNN